MYVDTWKNITTVIIMNMLFFYKGFILTLLLTCQPTFDLLSVAIYYFIFSQSSYEWDYTICVFSCLASSTMHNYVNIHKLSTIYQQYILGSLWVIFPQEYEYVSGYLFCFQLQVIIRKNYFLRDFGDSLVDMNVCCVSMRTEFGSPASM